MRTLNTQKLVEHIRNTKILLYSLVLALIIGMFGLGSGIRDLYEELITKDYQISVLTDEVGELREENTYMYQNLLENREFLTESVDAIQNSFVGYVEGNESEKNEMHATFTQVQTDLDVLIGEKEIAIASLRDRNQRLSEEVGFQAYSEEVENILIVGKNQDLTDTIILASINPSRETVTLISIPRDLYVNGRKINSIYASHGIIKLEKDIHMITGATIDKHVILDFAAFEKIVDILGGIDLYVREPIHDNAFPTADNGYTVYSIEEGSHHLDGEEALRYARSRKSTSDFDRSKRQHQVIQAIRVKLKMLDILADLDKAIEIYETVVAGIDTNIDVFEALYYMDNYQNYAIESGNVISSQNFLYSTKSVNGQYILLPKTGDYYQIKEYVSNLIKE
ncbi:LCP family protein [Patescibacteria group bacterium]